MTTHGLKPLPEAISMEQMDARASEETATPAPILLPGDIYSFVIRD
jgi:hypothetical protein